MSREFSKYERYYMYDNEISYKNIVIYPVLVKNYLEFFYFSECFTLDKNSVNDAKIISMTYLDYLYFVSSDEKPYIVFFNEILKLITRKENLNISYGRNAKGKAIFLIDDVEYNSTDFDEIKKIICEYNMVDLPDESIQKEIRDNMKKAQELRSRNNGKMASFEDQMVCVLISSNMSFDDIYKLSIRKFIKILERADAKLHYKIYLGATMSGMVEFKDKSFIKHWMADLNKEKLDLVPFEQIQDTVSGKKSNSKNSRNRKK